MEISVDSRNEAPPVEHLRPAEGWHVLHLFYQLDHAQWQLLTEDETLEAKIDFTALAQEIRATPDTQLLVFSIVTPKADIGFMLITPDLHDANAFEKRLNLALGPDILTPVFSYLSLTERDAPGEKDASVAAFEEESKGNEDEDSLYPKLPDWPVFGFYNLNHRRGEIHNWYSLAPADKERMLSERARVARKYEDRVRQVTTNSTGLDDAEWGVSLFAHDTLDIKRLVSEMRSDELHAKYADAGDFYIGIQLPLDELFRRVGL